MNPICSSLLSIPYSQTYSALSLSCPSCNCCFVFVPAVVLHLFCPSPCTSNPCLSHGFWAAAASFGYSPRRSVHGSPDCVSSLHQQEQSLQWSGLIKRTTLICQCISTCITSSSSQHDCCVTGAGSQRCWMPHGQCQKGLRVWKLPSRASVRKPCKPLQTATPTSSSLIVPQVLTVIRSNHMLT